MMNTFDLMGPINISIYNEYYMIVCNHYKLNEVGSDITLQLTSQQMKTLRSDQKNVLWSANV